MALKNYKKNVNSIGGDQGAYLKLKEEQAVRVALLGEEITGYGRFDGSKVLPSKPGEEDSYARFAINVWVFLPQESKDDPPGCVQILSSVKSLYMQLGELDKDLGGGLENYVVGIKKTSKKKYEVRGIRPLTDNEKELISKQELHNLEEMVSWYVKSEDEPHPPQSSDSTEDDIGF